MIKAKYFKTIFSGALGWILSLIVIVPFMVVVVNSLKTEAEANLMNLSMPKNIQLQNYIEVISKGNMVRSFFNSLLISTVCVLLGILVSAMAAFIMSRNKTRLNRFCYYLFFIGLIAPVNYITTIKTLKFLHINNSYTGIILFNSALAIPFAVFLFAGFISTVPKEIDESGTIDGCNSMNLFVRIVFPLLKPVTITASILTFISSWNDFMTPLYLLNQSQKWTMILSVYNFWGFYTSQWNLICSVIVLTLLPILIIYIFAQRYIIAGMTAGSVKG